MTHRRYSVEEIAHRGKDLYQKHIRSLVETEENIGKIVSVDIETGDYYIGIDVLQAAESLHQARQDAVIWSERIGYDAVYALGGSSIRVNGEQVIGRDPGSLEDVSGEVSYMPEFEAV